jgi:hypothetical protein
VVGSSRVGGARFIRLGLQHALVVEHHLIK